MSVVSVSKTHTLVVSNENHLLVCGPNPFGKLVHPDVNSLDMYRKEFEVAVQQVAAGVDFTAVVTSSGQLHMCGTNTAGQLGRPDRNATAWGLVPGFGNMHQASMVACGDEHTVVLTKTGTVFTFGHDEAMPVIFETNQMLHFGRVPQAIPRETFQMQKQTLEPIVMVAAGQNNTIVVSSKGSVYCWGNNNHNVLGIGQEFGTTPTKIDPAHFQNELVTKVAIGDGHAAAITAEGGLFTWGCEGLVDTEQAQLGRGKSGSETQHMPTRFDWPWQGNAVDVACGSKHTLVVTDKGELWGCGNNEYGQLGLGAHDMNIRYTFCRIGERDFEDSKVTAVAAGGNKSITVTEDGGIWEFGVRDFDISDPGVITRFDTEYKAKVLVLNHRKLAFVMGMHERLCKLSGSTSVVRSLSDMTAMKILEWVLDAEDNE